MPTQQKLRSRKWLDHYTQNETKYAVLFFTGGFLFDIFTLSEPDDLLSIVQQIVYLTLIGALLIFEEKTSLDTNKPSPDSENLRWPWLVKYHQAVVQFLFGSLLSVYSIYFFQSSSFYKSFLFIVTFFALLVLNELPRFQSIGLRVRYSLWTLCLISFSLTVVPVVMGSTHFVTLITAFLFTAIICYFWGRWSSIFHKDFKRHIGVIKTDQKLRWSLSTLLIFVIFYFLKVLPPVPLSLKHLGAYHSVVKLEDGRLEMISHRPWYAFWRRGDEVFEAAPGDRIFLALAVYSPARISETIYVHWLQDSNRGWLSAQRIPIAIHGGRKDGFRGVVTKANYSPGDWRAQIETEDGRELGRITINVENSPPASPPRTDYL